MDNITTVNILQSDEDLLYMRKSRADSPDESVEEVLAKHETLLQELAVRELGGRIPEHCIIREVVSGETIDERPGMMQLLARIESPNIKRVFVVEPQRLSRGDLEDCGRIVNAFRYSNTKITTLTMTYDLSNKMHRKFFEQELTRGNDYLEYTKEILLRGRILAIQNKGAYIGNIPPFGYDKAIIDGVHSLVPNENADAVRLVYDLYVNHGMTCLQIGRHLDSIGVKPMRGDVWEKSSIRAMLHNVHYVGLVKFGSKKSERVYVNGEIKKRRGIPADKEDIIIAKGKHQAIVEQAVFDSAQERMNNNPRANWDAPLKNPLAGLMFCSKCGKAIVQHPYKFARDRYECRNRNGCGSKSAYMDEVIEAVVSAMELEFLPSLKVKLKNNEGKSFSIQQKQIQRMKIELEELQKKEAKQYDLLESGLYTPEIFTARNKAIKTEMDALKIRIAEVGQTLPKEIDYGAKVITLQQAIVAMRDDSITPLEKNKLLKTIIKRIDYEYVAHEGKGKVRYRLHISLLV